MTFPTTPYHGMMPRPAADGPLCPVCDGPTDRIITKERIRVVLPDGGSEYANVPYAFWCSDTCQETYREAVRAYIHRAVVVVHRFVRACVRANHSACRRSAMPYPLAWKKSRLDWTLWSMV